MKTEPPLQAIGKTDDMSAGLSFPRPPNKLDQFLIDLGEIPVNRALILTILVFAALFGPYLIVCFTKPRLAQALQAPIPHHAQPTPIPVR